MAPRGPGRRALPCGTRGRTRGVESEPAPPLDGLLPPQMARRAEEVGVAKAALALGPLFVLGVLAGAFIALGAVFSNTVLAGSAELPHGVARLLGGASFCLGLILVVVGGAELFTGNTLLVMAWASRRVSTRALLRNWGVVYVGNFVGALGTAALVGLARQHEFGGGLVGEQALATAAAKVRLEFGQAVALGVLGNALVCLAVWLTFSARTVAGRIVAILFPITGFVAAGFEHCVANMYYLPHALWIEAFDPAFVAGAGLERGTLGWDRFLLDNLLPVTLGNVLGGGGLVAAVYWLVYLRRDAVRAARNPPPRSGPDA